MKATFLSIFIGIVLMLSACSNSSTNSKEAANEAQEKSLTFLFNFPTSTLDPHQDDNSTTVRAGITETLVKLNEDLELEPWLASEWKAIDELTWSFTVQEGVLFQDGTTLDAEAVKQSFERGINVSESMKAALKLESISTDGNSVIFKTTQPLPAFPSELTHPHTSIVKVEDDEKLRTAPIGTGPFVVDTFDSEVKVELTKNTSYWNGEPKLDKVAFGFNSDANARAMALQSGEADIIYYLPSELATSLKSDKNIVVESVSSLRTHFISYNMNSSEVADENVRQALDSLFDREAVANDLMGGMAVPAGGPFNPDFPFSMKADPVKYDSSHAKKLLEAAGYKEVNGVMEKNGEPLQLEMITYQSRPELPLIAQMLQSNAKEIGVEINIKSVENIDEYLSTNEEWDIATYSNLTSPRGDVGYFLNSAYSLDGALNIGEINDPEINEILTELNKTTDVEKRNDVGKQVENMTQQKIYQSYIVHPMITVAMNKDVKNYSVSKQEYYLITNQLDVE